MCFCASKGYIRSQFYAPECVSKEKKSVLSKQLNEYFDISTLLKTRKFGEEVLPKNYC